jgi:hypothetical protein
MSTGTKETVQFTRAMTAATFTTTSFTLWNNATQIPALPSYDAATFTATLTPTQPLSYLTTYTVKLTTAITSADPTPVPLAAPITWTFTTTGTMVAKRMNTGGAAWTSPLGVVWDADAGFKNGLTEIFAGRTIANTTAETQPLYRDDRYGSTTAALFTYNISIPNGTYDVKLHFVELTKTAIGQRVFSIDIIDTPGLPPTVPYDVSNLDIFQAAPGANTALVRTITGVTILDSTLSLRSYAVTDLPEIAAIEIIPVHP